MRFNIHAHNYETRKTLSEMVEAESYEDALRQANELAIRADLGLCNLIERKSYSLDGIAYYANGFAGTNRF